MKVLILYDTVARAKPKKLGFQIAMPPLVTYVEGKMNQMELKQGELEKTKNWTQEATKTLSK